jgi:Domain of unknown function (DUF5666)
MKRFLPLPLVVLGLLAACGEKPPRTTEMQVEVDVVQPGVVCRAGKDGAPLVADRGIGGTGSSFSDHLADRGIGGTGILGVVTGFASVCIGGIEVRYDGDVPVDLDGNPSQLDQLRVGQVVAIKAASPVAGTSLPSWARAISVRTEVAGPIEAVEPGNGAMTIAGQRVVVSGTTWGASRFGLGDWTTVSGLRQPGGTIVASRLDDAPQGKLFVRGQVSRHNGAFWIDRLRLAAPPATSLRDGDQVAAAGTYQSGAGQLAMVGPDPLAADPLGYFGDKMNQVVMQAFVTVDGDAVWLNDRIKVAASPAVRQPKPTAGDAIVTLERQPDGSLLATGLRYTKYPAPAGETMALAHAWHVATVVPLPPLPPMAGPPLEARPPDSAPGSAADASHRTPDPMAGPSPLDTPQAGAPFPPISCAVCGQGGGQGGVPSAGPGGGPRDVTRLSQAFRRAHHTLVSARHGPSGKTLPVTNAVFSTPLPSPTPAASSASSRQH